MDADTPDAVARRICWAQRLYTAYNISRIREMLRYLPPRGLELFEAVPLLLHLDHPQLPGYRQGRPAPHGIWRFHRSGYLKRGAARFGLALSSLRPWIPAAPAIRGLYVMGSVGTLAQTQGSDLDYWVVVDPEAATPNALGRLEQKLARIAAWGWDRFHQQIAFFVLDSEQVRRNAFGGVDAESSGSAQRTLLKEEFYRTFVTVAGQIPYWSVLPPRLPTVDYHRHIAMARQARHPPFEDDDYLDLGPLDRIAPSEALSAVLWQIYKARQDPVKALIKASLIAHYFFYQQDTGLLCDQVKAEYLDTGQGPAPELDPYARVFEAVEAFYRRIEDRPGLDLIRRGIFLRLIGFPMRRPNAAGSPKARLRDARTAAWGWSPALRRDMQDYPRWSLDRHQRFEQEILAKIGFVFELIRCQDNGPDGTGFDMTAADFTVLKNRIAAAFKALPEKVDRCPSAVRMRAAAVALSITGNPAGAWELRFADQGTPLLAMADPVRLLGWLVGNRLTPNQGVRVGFAAAGLPPPGRRIETLWSQAVDFFAPAPGDAAFARAPGNDRILVVLTHNRPFSDPDDLRISYLWRNTWDEMFHATDRAELEAMPTAMVRAIAQRIHAFVGPAPEAVYRVVDLRMGPQRAFAEAVAAAVESLMRLPAAADNGHNPADPRADGVAGAPMLDLFSPLDAPVFKR